MSSSKRKKPSQSDEYLKSIAETKREMINTKSSRTSHKRSKLFQPNPFDYLWEYFVAPMQVGIVVS
jgi:hypothetical protein